MKHQTVISVLTGKCRELLSHRYAGAVILLLVIAGRIIQQVFFFNTRSDMSYQVLGAEHLLQGHGISLAAVSPADISQVNYLPLNNWPPGFSLLFIPFYLLFGKNYILAGIALGITAAIVLVVMMRKIMSLLGAPVHLLNLFTLLTGFFGYYFYTFPCTDAVAITSFIAAFYFALMLLRGQGHFYRSLALLIVTLLLAGFTKYLFMPAMLIVPAFLLAQGIFNKQQLLKKAGLISLASLLLITGAFLLTQKKATGTVGFIKESSRGFYPQNLQSAFPFVTAAFSRPDTAAYLTGNNDIVFKAMQVITLVLALALGFIWLNHLYRHRLYKISVAESFFQLGCWVSAGIVALLIMLSLRVGKETFDFGYWTYVQEPRYYGLIIILLQLAAFVYYIQSRQTNKYYRTIFVVLLILLGVEAAKGLAFTGNRIIHFGKEKYGWQQELSFQQDAGTIIKNIQARQPGLPAVLTGTADWMMLRVSLYSHIPFFKTGTGTSTLSAIKASANTILVLMIKEEDLPVYNSFISLNGAAEEGMAGGFHFYSCLVKP